MVTFNDVLKKIREESENSHVLGKKFEILTKNFFETDKLYENRFTKVWLWKEWPKNDGQDTGIDLIAEERDGSLCAIQCKCYADDGSLSWKAVSTFLAKAKALEIKNTILVYTGESFTDNARKGLTKCQIIDQSHFRDSSIDWNEYPNLKQKKPKELYDYQTTALENTLVGLKSHDRGKLIMACGTGKTLTSLHIAEKYSKKGKIILYLVPSISLILQTMRTWSDNANIKHNYIVVCSDKSTGEDGSITELESPVSTDIKTLKKSLSKIPNDKLTVIFSTYHSLQVVKKSMGNLEFDIIFCDEAHRTTGVEDKSFFTLVHDDSIKAKKRLYMTATPRVYSDTIKAKLDKEIYSMDDESKYGPTFHNFTFSEAVKQGALTDFRVKIAIVPPETADRDFLQSILDKDDGVPVDERTLLASIWHGLNYPNEDKKPKLLQRVIAFANRIDRSEMFAGVNTDDNDHSLANISNSLESKWKTGNKVKVKHVDGKTRAIERRNQMHWLNESTDDENTCRIISNARCLSEGVDVPALDGVIFLNPRRSKVDVVQSVGRVMRKSKGKDYGYVILPIALSTGKPYHESLDNNETFKVVWQVLNALRSHDEDFANEINQLILSKDTEPTSPTPRISISVLDGDYTEVNPRTEFFTKIKSKLVEKVGDIDYYDKYGKKLGSASRSIEAKIKSRKNKPHVKEQIIKLNSGLKEIINDSISQEETIRIIAQHMVLSRVFDALFQGEFTSHNPVSVTLNEVVKKLKLEDELESLKDFYKDVEIELNEIKDRKARQNFIKKIYENFFKSVAKKETEKLGIVYTPVEIIDFILNSVQWILEKEFETNFSDRSVKILDPFAGTGTFLSRLLESGMLDENIYEKYKNDIFANEIILLAYYIATINIETTYSSLRQGNKYVPFNGIIYTDTLEHNPRWRFGEHKQVDTTLDDIFKETSERILIQQKKDIDVIIGNPPYSSGQKSFDDNNKNRVYPIIDKRIKNTYLKKSKEVNPELGATNSLKDSYVRSLRWASDRIGESGVVGFITNASFIMSEVGSGIRACLEEEFTDVWVFDLLGKKGMEGHGRNAFEYPGVSSGGTTTRIAIIILVKNPNKEEHTIHYSSLTKKDYSGSDKRVRVKELGSIKGIQNWKTVKPDKYHDWVKKRILKFENYLPIGSKSAKGGKENAVFKTYVNGVKTKRDAWAYNSSKKKLTKNMKTHITYYNKQDWQNPISNPKKAKWSKELTDLLKRKGKQRFSESKIRTALYRPFFKQYIYLDKVFNQTPTFGYKAFPETNSENLVILYGFSSDIGTFGIFISDTISDLKSTNSPTQCFSLYTYENGKKQENITNTTLKEYQEYYKNDKIKKLDIFYYIYGLLHHKAYQKKYTNNLFRDLPYIPMADSFFEFSKIGKKLAKLHLSWETCKRYKLVKSETRIEEFDSINFAIEKVNKKRVRDTTTIQIINKKNVVATLRKIPPMNYKVNGRTPLEWAINRYRVKIDGESGIINNSTKMDDEPIDIIPLIERLVYVGVESDRLISKLPKEFEPKNSTPKKNGLDKHV